MLAKTIKYITDYIDHLDLFGLTKRERCKKINITTTAYDTLPIFRAIFDNDLLEVMRLINAGEDLNVFWNKPLHAALICGNHEIVKALVEGGAIVNLPFNAHAYDYYATCIINSGSLETLKYMMQVSTSDYFKPDNLFLSVIESGHLEMVKYVAQFITEAVDKHESILIAYLRGHKQMVRYLLSIGYWTRIIWPYDYIEYLCPAHLAVINDPEIQRYIKYRYRDRKYDSIFSDIIVVIDQ